LLGWFPILCVLVVGREWLHKIIFRIQVPGLPFHWSFIAT
jgi:hypothetical protein